MRGGVVMDIKYMAVDINTRQRRVTRTAKKCSIGSIGAHRCYFGAWRDVILS